MGAFETLLSSMDRASREKINKETQDLNGTLDSHTLATWCEEPTHWKKPWYWERLRAGEGGGRGQDGWMASPPQWSWVWANSGRWWRAGSLLCCSPWGHRVGHDWVNEQQQDQMPLADICRAFCPKAAEYIFFSRVYVTFSRVDHMLGHTLRFSKFKKIEKPLAWLIKKKREIAQISNTCIPVAD